MKIVSAHIARAGPAGRERIQYRFPP